MEHTTHARTIAVTYRNRSRFARIRLRYPGRRSSRLTTLTNGYPGDVKLPDYNAELALELIGDTCELPTSKRDLLIVLAHYRHALHVLATQAATSQDFFLGQVTRDHVDIDWDAWADDAPVIAAALRADGYRAVAGPPPDQQLDVARDGLEMSFAWLARGHDGKVTVAGGEYAGEPWPDGMLDWPAGRIGLVRCPIISPHVQIACKEMWTSWVPGCRRRQKDGPDVARLRRALQSRP